MAISQSGGTYISGREPVRLRVSYIYHEFLSVFGLKPVARRGFLASEERKGAAPVCVLSESFWSREFGGSPAALGRPMVLDGKRYTIGRRDTRHGAQLFREARVWVSLEADPAYEKRGINYLRLTGLLKSGVSMRQAQSANMMLARATGRMREFHAGSGTATKPK